MPVSFSEFYVTPQERGLLGESFPANMVVNTNVLGAAGTLEFARIKVPQAGRCTSVVICVTTAGSTLTAGQNFAALFYSSGLLLAQSVDQTSNWGGTGLKEAQLNGGPYYLHAGEYYAAVWYNGSTSPTVARTSHASPALLGAGFAAPNLPFGTANTGLTTAAPATLGTQTGTGRCWWMALQ